MRTGMASDTIVLIGMAGAGKSTVGVLLAKALSWEFIDTDLIIQRAEGMRLQALIETKGVDAFRELEERHILSIACDRAVVATGGSAVYSEAGMAHLQSLGAIVYLEVSLASLRERIADIESRGLVKAEEQTFDEVYVEREPLYRRYADLRVNCEGLNHEAVVDAILEVTKAV